MMRFRALGRIDGPWWGARADVLAALVAQTVAAVGTGKVQELERFLIEWEPRPLILLPWEDAVAIMTGEPDVQDGDR